MITLPKIQVISRPSHQFNGWLKALTILFVGFSLVAAITVFFYPLEIETRESAIWLHVLALKQGINLYDHSQVTFVETHKGPLDPLIKFLIASVFPFLESWQVIRFIALLLPCAFGLVAWKLLRSRTIQTSPWRILYLSSIGYLLLLLNAKEFLYVGRPDATAALLFLGFIFLAIPFAPIRPSSNRYDAVPQLTFKADRHILLHGIVCGISGMMVTLTHWRIAPCVATVVLFTTWCYWQAYAKTLREALIYLGACSLSALGVWLIMFFSMFGGDWSLYYRHTYGLFSKDSGWGVTDSGRGSILRFLLDVFNPYADPSALKGGPLLIAIAIYLLIPNPNKLLRQAWLMLGGTVFLANAIPYYFNYNGGGAWYFIPFVILLWYYFMLHASQLSLRKLTLLGTMIVLLILLNYRAVLLPTVHRIATMGQAGQFMEKLRSLQTKYSLLSEDTFLFRTQYQGDVIDSGDEVLAVYKSGYYGPAFQQTIKRYLSETQRNPPDYIVTGFTQSQELEDLIDAKYTLAATGPQNFTANARESLKLFQRRAKT
jgi:hypothetical protein